MCTHAAGCLFGTAALLGGCSDVVKQAPLQVSSVWQDAPLLAVDNEWGAFDYDLAHDDQGNTLAVWEQFDGQRYNIWANRKAKGQGWGVARLIETDNLGSAYNPRIAMDSQGNAVAVWQQSDGQHSRIAANRYMVGTGWSTAQWIDAPATLEAHAPQVRFDSQGNAVAVWQHKAGQRTRIAANRMVSGVGWGEATQIENGNGYASAPHLSRDTQGQVRALWQLQGNKATTFHAVRYVPGAGWSSDQQLNATQAGADYPPAVFDTHSN